MGRNEKNKPVRRVLFHYDDCIGCGACVSVCKFKCLYMEREDKAKNDERVLDFLEKKKAGLIEEKPKPPPKPKEEPKPEEKKELIE
jgi:formate hydrogenlyase subunit 6/NADH:ubiquinone oxidoreductase subunit I